MRRRCGEVRRGAARCGEREDMCDARSPRESPALGEMACPQAVASTFRPGVELRSIRYRDERKRCHTRAKCTLYRMFRRMM